MSAIYYSVNLVQEQDLTDLCCYGKVVYFPRKAAWFTDPAEAWEYVKTAFEDPTVIDAVWSEWQEGQQRFPSFHISLIDPKTQRHIEEKAVDPPAQWKPIEDEEC